MSPETEDRIGQAAMTFVFLTFLILKVAGVAAWVRAGMPGEWPLLRLLQDALSLGFTAMVVTMTLRRLPASRGPDGWEPRVTAVAGTFALMALIALPSGEAPVAARLVAVIIMAVGLAGSIHALLHLGRAFSIAPTARTLVTSGPYGMVRHPLYLTEGITTIGVIISHWSWAALALGLVQMALQWRRIGHEERILRGAFPDQYPAYAARVPQLLPRLRRAAVAAE